MQKTSRGKSRLPDACAVVILIIVFSCEEEKDLCEQGYDLIVDCNIDPEHEKDVFISQCRNINDQAKDISDACWDARKDTLECTVDLDCKWLNAPMDDKDNPCYGTIGPFVRECEELISSSSNSEALTSSNIPWLPLIFPGPSGYSLFPVSD